MTTWATLAIAYAVASRLAYVGWVGAALTRQQRDRYFTATAGVEAGFQRFRRWAKLAMWNDAASLVLVFVLTRDTIPAAIPRATTLIVGAVLIVIGLGTKMWAANALGPDAYYWHNFFAPDDRAAPEPRGPYRYISNPMYTVGYLHAWGLALVLASMPGLAVTLFAQLAILAFHHLVEKPHYRRWIGTALETTLRAPLRSGRD